MTVRASVPSSEGSQGAARPAAWWLAGRADAPGGCVYADSTQLSPLRPQQRHRDQYMVRLLRPPALLRRRQQPGRSPGCGHLRRGPEVSPALHQRLLLRSQGLLTASPGGGPITSLSQIFPPQHPRDSPKAEGTLAPSSWVGSCSLPMQPMHGEVGPRGLIPVSQKSNSSGLFSCWPGWVSQGRPRSSLETLSG